MPAPIDFVFLGLLLIIVALAALRGFVEELTGIAWFVAGGLFALSFFRQAAQFLRTKTLHDTPYIPELLAFASLFLAAFVAVKIIGAMLKELVERAGISTVDKMLGFLFGFVKGVVIIALLIFIIKIQPFFDGEELLNDSIAAKVLSPGQSIIEKTLEQSNV